MIEIEEVEKSVSRNDDYWVRFNCILRVGFPEHELDSGLKIQNYDEDSVWYSSCWLIYGDTYDTSGYTVHPSDKSKGAHSSSNILPETQETKEDALCRLISQTDRVLFPVKWDIHEEDPPDINHEMIDAENLEGDHDL